MDFVCAKAIADSLHSTNLRLSKSTIGTSDDFSVSVTVQNAGTRDGQEVVQVYITDLVSSVATPVQQLSGFQKVLIPCVVKCPHILCIR